MSVLDSSSSWFGARPLGEAGVFDGFTPSAVDKGQLIIRGERRDEHPERTDGPALSEVRYGRADSTGCRCPKGAEAQRIAIESK